MNHSVSHRGPDDSGEWSDEQEQVFFGHQRLSIIDLSQTGHQPMISQQGNVVTFNGEIYNYRELRKQVSDYQFKSQSDTEVLLALYEKSGYSCLQQLDGMFAFALWDCKRKELFLARDRAGEKPLYYSVDNGIFAFSSELKSLLQLPWIKADLDEKAFYHFLTFNQLAPPFTMFKGISKMPPATMMTVDASGIRFFKPYWEVEYFDYRQVSKQELAEKTYTLLKQSVHSQMISDVPVGAFLSGGVDSSAVVALMSQKSSGNIKTYSIGFENQPDYDELKFAASVSKQFNTEHFERIVTASEITEFVPRMAEIFDEPLADSTCIPIYFIAQKAREEGTIVVLTGDGSDEIFAGYRNYNRYLKHYRHYHRYIRLPQSVKKLIACAAGFLKETSPATEMFHRAALNQEFFWGAARSFKESQKKKFLSEKFQKRSALWSSYEIIEGYKQQFENLQKAEKDDLDWMCYLGFKMNDTNRYLFRADRLGMAASVETRAPFLNYKLVNHALSIPSDLKIHNEEPKYILKRSLEKILSTGILYRKKMGFSVPLREWAGGYMTDYVEKHLASFCTNTGLFDQTGLRKLVNTIRSGDKNVTNDLFTIYFLMSWFKKWMNV